MTDTDRDALLTALTTEHFVLQSAASTTVTESSARASLYLMTLSSSLVAIGFTFESAAFAPMTATVIPVIFVLGVFTVVRLVDTGVENVAHLTRISQIRAFYRTLGPSAATYFPTTGRSADETVSRITGQPEATAQPAGHWMGAKALFTMASMIAVLNSIVAGANLTLAVRQGSNTTLAFIAGAIGFCASFATFLWYQNRRYATFDASNEASS